LDWKPNISQNPKDHFDPFPRLFSDYVYPQGIVAVNAASNVATEDLASQEPSMTGGSSSGLIVVGNADQNSNNAGSSAVDTSGTGILTIYANGVNICAAARAAPFDYVCQSGSSPATAQVAGLAAYYLSIPSVQNQIVAPGMSQVSLTMKNYLISVATSRKGTFPDKVPRAAIDEEINCQTSNPFTLTVPVFGTPVPTNVITPFLDTYPSLIDADNDLDLTVAQLAAASGTSVVLSIVPTVS
jgi:hypothetical protein